MCHVSADQSQKQKADDQNVMETLMKKLQDSEVANSSRITNHPPQQLYRHPHAHEKSTSGEQTPAASDGKRTDSSIDVSPIEANKPDDKNEVAALRRQLAAQEQQMAVMQAQLDQTRTIAGTPDFLRAPIAVYHNDSVVQRDVSDGTIARLQDALNAKTRPLGVDPVAAWDSRGATTSEDDDEGVIHMLPGQNMWSANASFGGSTPVSRSTSIRDVNNRAFMANNNIPYPAVSNRQQTHPHAAFVDGGVTLKQPVLLREMAPPLSIDTSRNLNGYTNAALPTPVSSKDMMAVHGHIVSRPSSAVGSSFMPYNAYSMAASNIGVSHSGMSPPITPGPYGNNSTMIPHPAQHMPRPIGTRPSPPGSEYGGNAAGPWNNQLNADSLEPTYIPPVEPLNYRRLLARNASCNWDYIVDKIIHHDDQQASLFLQQKVKQATPEHRHQIIESIISKAFPLMVNRFGNFLIQRCFEHGTPEQIVAIATAICGNTLQLSMDAFGCHVVQKAFDVVPEEYKAMMVHELLRQIPQTVCHRYSCHVWQKLFELRWSDSPPQIMKYVNEALSGMWHSVALGETGSLVVQNIFENCLEEDKRPCIDECLNSIDEISRGQFGNWCIQHICEHGAARDRNWAIEHILNHAQEYSTDQYASKVVEKCLKIGGDEFMERYLERVCEARTDRPRQAIIDISGDQYGNYLVQWILANAGPHHREVVSMHVRKHMVSLRGSKYGSRVAMLCGNPQSATRPGAPADFQIGRYNNQNGANNGIGMGMGGSSRNQYTGPYR